MEPYGHELILDLHQCNLSKFNREDIDTFFAEVCRLTEMVQCERFWWDDIGVPEDEQQTAPQAKGTSAVQFILTSSIVVHTLDLLGNVYINVFTCKEFDQDIVAKYAEAWFGGTIAARHFIERL
jgi:S-adenosylmethionine/arginine decarboxylase-like enzyme